MTSNEKNGNSRTKKTTSQKEYEKRIERRGRGREGRLVFTIFGEAPLKARRVTAPKAPMRRGESTNNGREECME